MIDVIYMYIYIIMRINWIDVIKKKIKNSTYNEVVNKKYFCHMKICTEEFAKKYFPNHWFSPSV